MSPPVTVHLDILNRLDDRVTAFEDSYKDFKNRNARKGGNPTRAQDAADLESKRKQLLQEINHVPTNPVFKLTLSEDYRVTRFKERLPQKEIR